VPRLCVSRRQLRIAGGIARMEIAFSDEDGIVNQLYGPRANLVQITLRNSLR
jgi:hypothetical protein